ncbi:MAG: zf-HC2 domain-containing protein [Deltaproteobacteria bacterium]|nr:zf-HC2 domain-containing protein [Deltaproteobacteria bacterium]
MECSKVKELLSEYLDGMLDEEASARVQAHLSECADCRDEHASLKALVHELGAMEAVTPPVDFLARLHERMEEPSWFSKLMHTLFVPLRFKIPLEFAAVALAVMIIFSMLNVPFDVRKASMSPEKPMIAETGERAYMQDVSKPSKQETPEPEAPVKRSMAKALEEERKPLEMLLVLREQRPSRLMAKASRAPGPGRERFRSRSDRALHSGVEERDYAAQGQMGAGGKASVETKAPLPQPPPTVQKVTDAITMLGGQVVSPKETWHKEKTSAIIARIPAKNYTPLVEELCTLGTLQSPVPMPSDTYEGTIQLRIKVLPE